jgi:DnaJ-class molecular chaperone
MTHLILIALAAGPGYLISLYLWPWKACPRCKGSGRNPGSNTRRHGDCKRCGGTRRVQRIGSRAIHKAVRGTTDAARNRKK